MTRCNKILNNYEPVTQRLDFYDFLSTSTFCYQVVKDLTQLMNLLILNQLKILSS